ncbi:hypothetical protein BD410DRAFT_899837 [Rickenella mellea]|uniref:F-box domain-containing protein n=1 Tax=Rickenella mellea TaxID=50990 RepID=A0A4Y7PYU1_9AGAM|nr:hypothetical protein BD410DRAFT_899837 [Rickenella mellea]
MDQLLLEDILLYILDKVDRESLLNTSLVNRFWRRVALPNVFRWTRISGNWKVAGSQVERILRCDMICSLVHKFIFRVEVWDGTYYTLAGTPLPFSGDRMLPNCHLPTQLVKLLCKMPNLTSLEFFVPEDTTPLFADAFSEDGLRLPSISKLSVSPFCHFLVRLCPGLRQVATSGEWQWMHSRRGALNRSHSFALMKSLAGLPIESFAMWEWWTPDILAALFESLPNLKSLRMSGGGYRLKDHLTILSQFNELESLELASVSYLSVGYHPPKCGSAYDGMTQEEHDFLDRQFTAAKERAIIYVAYACPTVKRLSFSANGSVIIRHNKHGISYFDEETNVFHEISKDMNAVDSELEVDLGYGLEV